MQSFVALLTVFSALSGLGAAAAAKKKPNILFILTDDQDLHMQSVQHMPNLQSLIINPGTTYTNHYCTVALCCPSRATLWTGRAAHNHNVTSVAPPFGGYPKVVSQGVNDDNLFLWMQDAGYETYYAGKLWNFHSVDNFNKPYARGFDASDFLLDPYTYQYWNAKISSNGDDPVSYAGQYSTDIVAEKAASWLETKLKHDQDKPFFMTVAPIAPHSNWVIEPENNRSYLVEPLAAPRHQHLFKDYKIPRDVSFNTPVKGGASWVGRLKELNDTVIEYNDHYQRQRLRALQAVDEMVAELVGILDREGVLEDTYVFYTTDNGYHISQHGMLPGKECGFDTDIHIPFYVRGPGLGAGEAIDSVTSHTDVASTLLKLAGIEKQLDGTAMPLESRHVDEKRHEHIAIEYWGPGIPEGLYGGRTDLNREAGKWQNFYLNNTYKGLRLVSKDYSLYYSAWCTNETELYDLKTDPHQTTNIIGSPKALSFKIANRPVEEVIPRFEALIMVLKTCKGHVCTHPWEALHGEGGVKSLAQALDSAYDKFYADQPRMWFTGCPQGYWADWESQEPVRRLDVDGNGHQASNDKQGQASLAVQGGAFDFTDHWHLLT